MVETTPLSMLGKKQVVEVPFVQKAGLCFLLLLFITCLYSTRETESYSLHQPAPNRAAEWHPWDTDELSLEHPHRGKWGHHHEHPQHHHHDRQKHPLRALRQAEHQQKQLVNKVAAAVKREEDLLDRERFLGTVAAELPEAAAASEHLSRHPGSLSKVAAAAIGNDATAALKLEGVVVPHIRQAVEDKANAVHRMEERETRRLGPRLQKLEDKLKPGKHAQSKVKRNYRNLVKKVREERETLEKLSRKQDALDRQQTEASRQFPHTPFSG